MVLHGGATASAQVETPCHCRYISALAVIPYGQHPLPRRAAVMGSNGWRSPYPPVTFKALVRPWWFMGRSSLKPKNQPMGVRPRCPALVDPYAT